LKKIKGPEAPSEAIQILKEHQKKMQNKHVSNVIQEIFHKEGAVRKDTFLTMGTFTRYAA